MGGETGLSEREEEANPAAMRTGAILRTRSPFAAALGDVALKSRARWNQFLDIDSQSIIISAVACKAACAPTKDGRRPMLLSCATSATVIFSMGTEST